MKVRTKTILVIISTLLIGMLFGALLDRMYTHYSYKKRFTRMRSTAGIVHWFESKIAPSDSQQAIVHEILENHVRKVQVMDSLMHQKMKGLADSLKQDLAPHVTAEQMKRLDEMFSRFKRGHKRRYGPARRSDKPAPSHDH